MGQPEGRWGTAWPIECKFSLCGWAKNVKLREPAKLAAFHASTRLSLIQSVDIIHCFRIELNLKSVCALKNAITYTDGLQSGIGSCLRVQRWQ